MPQQFNSEEEWLAYEESRGDLAMSPERMECYICEREGRATDRKVIKLGPVTNVADPTQTYVLECGHTII